MAAPNQNRDDPSGSAALGSSIIIAAPMPRAAHNRCQTVTVAKRSINPSMMQKTGVLVTIRVISMIALGYCWGALNPIFLPGWVV